MAEPLAQKVLLIGWDAADWKVIRPLLADGTMPTLKRLMDEGVWGNLASLQPMLSPMLWTSIATGKRSDKHGIHFFTEPDPSGQGIRPVSSTTRTCKALWNILSQAGRKVNVVGWFASHPAEPINGVCVTNYYQRAVAEYGQPWPMPPQTVHPERLGPTLADLRVHPAELDAAALLPFVPQVAQVDQDKDRRLSTVANLLAEGASVHGAATWILEHEPWDVMAVYYGEIDHFSHGFMHYHPPRMNHIPEEDFTLYKDVIQACYRFHDMQLRRLLELAGEDTTVILVSDHGYHSDHLRPLRTPRVPAGPAVWHRPYGICVLKGPNVKAGEQLYGGTLLDVTPTILTLLGLPVGADMDGRPWVQVFRTPVEVEQIASWEEVAGPSGQHPPEMHQDPFAVQEALQQLIDLGYIEKPSADAQQAIQQCQQESRHSLALAFLGAGRAQSAVALLEALVAEAPGDLRFAGALTEAYHALGRLADCRRLGEQTLALCKERPPEADLVLGSLEFAEGRTEAALEYLRRAEQAQPRLPRLHLLLGHVHLQMRRGKEAERAFRKALAIDGDSALAYEGLAAACLRQQRYEAALDYALSAVGLQHHLPQSHYYLGVALTRLGQTTEAVRAFETCLAIQPGMAPAHRWLARLYGPWFLDDPVKAAPHRRRVRELGQARRARLAAGSSTSPVRVS
ncbi:MAG: alkaline phosphatase family protein [Gemmataceae bacterium]|nr:alkaline phosphatase family protein [Gemmataceae bacterium]